METHVHGCQEFTSHFDLDEVSKLIDQGLAQRHAAMPERLVIRVDGIERTTIDLSTNRTTEIHIFEQHASLVEIVADEGIVLASHILTYTHQRVERCDVPLTWNTVPCIICTYGYCSNEIVCAEFRVASIVDENLIVPTPSQGGSHSSCEQLCRPYERLLMVSQCVRTCDWTIAQQLTYRTLAVSATKSFSDDSDEFVNWLWTVAASTKPTWIDKLGTTVRRFLSRNLWPRAASCCPFTDWRDIANLGRVVSLLLEDADHAAISANTDGSIALQFRNFDARNASINELIAFFTQFGIAKKISLEVSEAIRRTRLFRSVDHLIGVIDESLGPSLNRPSIRSCLMSKHLGWETQVPDSVTVVRNTTLAVRENEPAEDDVWRRIAREIQSLKVLPRRLSRWFAGWSVPARVIAMIALVVSMMVPPLPALYVTTVAKVAAVVRIKFAAVVGVMLPPPATALSGPKFAELAASIHSQYSQGKLALDISSDSQGTLNEWLKAKSPFFLALPASPPGPGEERPYRLEGARLMQAGGQTAVYIAYQMGTGPVSLIVAPASVAVASGGVKVDFKKVSFHYRTLEGYKVVTWSLSGRTYALVSQEGNSTQQSCMVCHSPMRDRDLSRTPTPLRSEPVLP